MQFLFTSDVKTLEYVQKGQSSIPKIFFILPDSFKERSNLPSKFGHNSPERKQLSTPNSLPFFYLLSLWDLSSPTNAEQESMLPTISPPANLIVYIMTVSSSLNLQILALPCPSHVCTVDISPIFLKPKFQGYLLKNT